MINKRSNRGLLYVAPALIVLLIVLILPALFAVIYSVLELKSVRPVGFAGFENYRSIFSNPELLWVLVRTMVFTVASVMITLGVALGIAVFLDKLTAGRAAFMQVLIVLPWIISTIVGALLIRWLFVSDISPGVYLMRLVGIKESPLTNPTLAMITLIVVAIWRTLGFAVLLLLAGIKAIPGEYYEAAKVDGATARQSFWKITLPLIKTPLVITTVILTMSNLNTVEAPLVTTGGGPGRATQILPLEIYERAFTYFDFSEGVALATVALILNLVLVFGYLRLVRWRV